MELEIALIRHGQLQSGAKRLIGMTDEPLGAAGERLIRAKLEAGDYPESELVYSSGLLRCRETARIIYPDVPNVLLQELRAPNYGDFEGESVDKLAQDKSFTRWMNAKGVPACPNGEEPYAIQARSIAAFRQIIEEMALKGLERSSIISHKMVIQEILQRYYVPRSNYKEWEIPYGGGFILRYDTIDSSARILKKI